MTHEKHDSSGALDAATATQIFDTVEGQVEKKKLHDDGCDCEECRERKRQHLELSEEIRRLTAIDKAARPSLPTVTDANKEEKQCPECGSLKITDTEFSGREYCRDCFHDWKKGTLEERGDVEANTVQGPMELLEKFYRAWIQCESSRGCYSCCNVHDSRCPAGRAYPPPGPCECGREELEALSELLDAAYAPSDPDGPKSSSGSGYPQPDLDLEASATLKVPEMEEKLGIKETQRANTVRGQTELLGVVKAAYLKHHCGLDNVGWEQLSNMMCDALCNAMGDTKFQRWLEENTR